MVYMILEGCGKPVYATFIVVGQILSELELIFLLTLTTNTITNGPNVE